MKKGLYILTAILLIFLAAAFYLSTLRFKSYEVNADNFRDYEEVSDVDYFKAYDAVLGRYWGFGNIQTVVPGLKEGISNYNNELAEFEFYGMLDNSEEYAVNISDCTKLRVGVREDKILRISQYHQSPKECRHEKGVLNERVNFLIQKGFTLKESNFKGNDESILVLDNNDEFLYVIYINFNGYTEEVDALNFKLINKRKYPALAWLS